MSQIYDDMLNDCHPVVKIGNLEFLPARVLYECDPIAYNCGESDYFDNLVTDFFYENRDCERDMMLTDGERTQTAVAWAFEMLENDEPINFDDLTELE